MKFIIIGAGNVGISLARLLDANHDVVLVDANEKAQDRIPLDLDLQVIIGNGSDPSVLLEAGIERADYLVSVASIDEVNIAVCLVARLINPNIKRIARIRTTDFSHLAINKNELPNFFDLIINPDEEGANYLMRMLKLPGATEVESFADGKLLMLGIEIDQFAEIAEKNLLQIGAYTKHTQFLIIAIVRDGIVRIPRGHDVIQPGDFIYCITATHHAPKVLEIAGKRQRKTKFAMVWAGSNLARDIAFELKAQGVKVKVILSETITDDLIDEFHDFSLFSAEGTDPTFLLEENISEMDVFIAATVKEEDNVLSALLAKKMGAHKVMAAINDIRYQVLVGTVGVDVVVSPHAAAAAAIVRHIHADAVVSEFILRDEQAAFVELTTLPSSPLVNTHFRDIKFPRDTLVAAIVRDNQVLVPMGDSSLKVGDRCIVFALRKSVKQIEKLFDVQLETLS